ncbi:MAG: rod-binding protein [Mariprofundus sp.]|nr:rod-binding protein [Mariprofundus sp.]
MGDLIDSVSSSMLQHAQQTKLNTKGAPQQVGLPLQHIEKKAVVADSEGKDPALWKASVQFEAIFIQQMMSEMRSTVNKSEFMPHGFAEDMHASMMDQAIAQASTKHQSMGIATAVYRQLEANNNKAHAIPNPADTLNIAGDLTTEALKDAR